MSSFKHIISINDFSEEELFGTMLGGCNQMVDCARSTDTVPDCLSLPPKVTLLFIEGSTRTKGSYWEAARLLGYDRYLIEGAEASSLSKNESMSETGRMLAIQNTSVLVMRTTIEGAQRQVADIFDREGYNVSVQNAGDGRSQHPTQTALDLLTIHREVKRLNRNTELHIGFVGDLRYGRTVHSLLVALHYLPGIRVTFVSASETAIPHHYKLLFAGRYNESDHIEALGNCDVIYVTRLQKERFDNPVEFQRVKNRFRLTQPLVDRWLSFNAQLKIMHPKPIDQGVGEIATELYGYECNIANKQAWYGIPARMYLLKNGTTNQTRKNKYRYQQTPQLTCTKEVSLQNHLEQRADRTPRYFKPIQNGTLIDHIPLGYGNILKDHLQRWKVAAQSVVSIVVHVIENVPSHKMGSKDVIVLENYFLDSAALGRLAALAPNATFNIVRDGMFRKYRTDSLPEAVTDIGRCPNQQCITHHDVEARPTFLLRENEFICYFCENHYTAAEILS